MPSYSTAISLRGLIISALLCLVAAASLPQAGGHDTEVLPHGVKATWTDYGPVLTLPDDFDVSHPAFNITALLELKEANKPILRIPGIPPPSKIKRRGALEAIEKGALACQTSSGSPNTIDAYQVSETLAKFPDIQWCCNSAPGQCVRMAKSGTAASSVCNWKRQNSCIPCTDAAAAVYAIANQCNSAQGKAGGFVRSVTPTHPQCRALLTMEDRFGTTVDVNVYKA